MSQTPLLSQLASRVDRLLLRHEELHRTNALLEQQVTALAQERDLLKSRLSAARTRVDALLARLPDQMQAHLSSEPADVKGHHEAN